MKKLTNRDKKFNYYNMLFRNVTNAETVLPNITNTVAHRGLKGLFINKSQQIYTGDMFVLDAENVLDLNKPKVKLDTQWCCM